MIISNLKNVAMEWNHIHTEYQGVKIAKPINTVYDLYKRMKASQLKVSRPVLTRLWNDSLSRHISDKGDVYNEANSIKFDTLNKLVKFFNRPAGDFFIFAGIPVTITIQLLDEFKKDNPKLYMKLNNMWKIKNRKKGDSIIRINYQDQKDRKIKNGYIFIAQPRYIVSGIGNEYSCLNIRYTHAYETTCNKLDKKQDDELDIRYAAEQDLKTLTQEEHSYLNTILFRNSMLTYPHLSLSFLVSFDFSMNTLDDTQFIPVRKKYFDHPEMLLKKDIKQTRPCKFAFKDLDQTISFHQLMYKMNKQR